MYTLDIIPHLCMFTLFEPTSTSIKIVCHFLNHQSLFCCQICSVFSRQDSQDFCHVPKYIIQVKVILPCPYGASCSHDDCWCSHSDPLFTSKIDDLINEVEDLKKRLSLVENRKVCECHHCPEAVPSVGCTDHVWKDAEKLRPVIPINEESFSHETSAQEGRKSETSAQPQYQPSAQKDYH